MNLLGGYRFDNDINISANYYYVDHIKWPGDGDGIESYHRLDLKLSKPFKIQGNSGDIALILQNIDSDYTDFYDENMWTNRLLLQARLNLN